MYSCTLHPTTSDNAALPAVLAKLVTTFLAVSDLELPLLRLLSLDEGIFTRY